jgi:hypothetical protein
MPGLFPLLLAGASGAETFVKTVTCFSLFEIVMQPASRAPPREKEAFRTEQNSTNGIKVTL